MNSKPRIVYLDLLRITACAMIILMHSPCPDASVPGPIQVPLYFITSSGLVLFFMVSGALILPVQGDTFKVLHRRMGKVLGPLVFWTLFYIIVNLITSQQQLDQLPRTLLSIPFSAQGHGVLWFMYTLVGLYLLAPLISPFLQKASKKELRFYLLIWVLTLFYEWLKIILEINDSTNGVLYYFTGYAGYFVLGYYLHTYGSKIPSWSLPFFILIPLICMLLFCWYKGEGLEPLFGYLSFSCAMMSFAWFVGFRRLFFVKKEIGGKLGTLLIELSNCAFGVYLMHIFIMRNILWNIDFLLHGLGAIGQIIMTWVLTLVISFAFTYAISWLPFAKYIIGYQQLQIYKK